MTRSKLAADQPSFEGAFFSHTVALTKKMTHQPRWRDFSRLYEMSEIFRTGSFDWALSKMQSFSKIPAVLDNSDKFSDNRVVRCCPKRKKCLILLVELTRIERATS